MSETSLQMRELRRIARPPRLLLVTPGGEQWIGWAARGLLALSQFWGGCASVVIPEPAVDEPALQPLLRAFQADHVVYLAAQARDCEVLDPAALRSALEARGIDITSRSAWENASYPGRNGEVAAAATAADRLRARVGVLELGGHTRLRSLTTAPEAAGGGLHTRSEVHAGAAWGVPQGNIQNLATLAAALQFGVTAEPMLPDASDRSWTMSTIGEFGSASLQSKLRELHGQQNELPPAGALLDPVASDCQRLSSRRYWHQRVVVVGSDPRDMALAGLCRQVLHAALWLPDSDTFLADALDIHGMAQANHATLTSVSVGQEQLLARVAAATRGSAAAADAVVALSDAAVGQPPAFGAVLVGPAADLDLSGQALVAYRDAWSQQTLLPVRATPLGGATAAVRLHPWIPDGLDAHGTFAVPAAAHTGYNVDVQVVSGIDGSLLSDTIYPTGLPASATLTAQGTPSVLAAVTSRAVAPKVGTQGVVPAYSSVCQLPGGTWNTVYSWTRDAIVGEPHMRYDGTVNFSYLSDHTTTLGTEITYNAGASWSPGGSVSVAKESTGSGSFSNDPGPRGPYWAAYWMGQFLIYHDHWINACRQYLGQARDVPHGWTGQLSQGASTGEFDGPTSIYDNAVAHNWMQTFPAGDTVTKISGQAATYSSGLNFGPISVTSSTTQGSEVTYIWHFGRATATHRLFGNNGTATSASILYSW